MIDLKETIAALAPEAEFVKAEGKPLEVILPSSAVHDAMKKFRDDKDLLFDFLVCLSGMDWGDSLGVVYHLFSLKYRTYLVVKTIAPDREKPQLYSVADIWATANMNEREVFDFFGIRFINHPDMRRLFLRNDFVGFPLRKDYDMSEENNPLVMSNEETDDMTPVLVTNEKGEVEEKQKVLFEDSEYVVNIGPQHPATHGVLHFRTSLEGEIIKKVDVHCGYIHRGIEKMAESLTYPQILGYTDRLDYLSAHQNRHAVCMCVEEALGLEIPDRVKYIRTIMDELSRLQSHFLFYSCLCMDMGALTPFFYGFRDREKILDLFEETTGGRLIQNYNVIGGVMADIHPDFVAGVKKFIKYLPPMLKEYHDVFTGNVIATQRLKGVGVLSKENAISYGVTGPSGRASGVSCDIRKLAPYGVYDKVDFKEIIYTEGDSFARYMVRMDEILESLHILEQLIDNIPAGDYAVKTKPIIRLPEGSFFKMVEAGRGAFGVYIESKGDKTPYRLKFRSSCLPLVSVVDLLASGAKIADLIAIGGTLDYVVPDIDR